MLQQYRKQETSARLKKFYSTIQQAVIKSAADGKPWDDWANANISSREIDITKNFQNNYLLPYISHNKLNIEGNFSYIYLNDGSYFSIIKYDCIDFIYDTNGKKKPNETGKDIYRFIYCPSNITNWIRSGSFIPYQPSYIKTREQALTICIDTSPSYCSTLLMMDGWEFKDDYPYSL